MKKSSILLILSFFILSILSLQAENTFLKKPVICVGNEQLHSIAATECYILLRTRNSGKTLEMASRNSDTKIKEFLQKAKKIFPEVKTQIHSVCTGLKKGSSNRERSSFLPCSEKVLLITLPINEQKVPALLDLARQCKLAPLEGRSAFSSNEFCVFYGNPSGEKAVQNLVYSRIFKESLALAAWKAAKLSSKTGEILSFNCVAIPSEENSVKCDHYSITLPARYCSTIPGKIFVILRPYLKIELLKNK